MFSNFFLLAKISSGLKGGLWTVSALTLCFLVTHLALFVNTKRKAQPPPIPQETPTKKEPTPAVQEPVYYIVEKKRRRIKSSYGEPKEIRFR